ncbi:MAG: hypothetical protein WDN45_00710 [Caulobacteraceae bacterium]
MVVVSDTDLQQGQGSHGSLSRGETHNFMAAVGPRLQSRLRRPVAGIQRRPGLDHIQGRGHRLQGQG